MSHPLTMVQALLALLSLFSGAWVLLNTKSFKDPVLTLLAGVIGIACSGYLFCEIAIQQATASSQLVRFEKASTGLAIVVLGLLPALLSRRFTNKATPYLTAHGCIAIALLAFNSLSRFSLRFETLRIETDNKNEILTTFSNQTYLFLALALSAIAYTIKSAVLAKKSKATRSAITTSLLALVLAACIGAETLAALQNQFPTPAEWFAVSCISACAIAWRVSSHHPSSTAVPQKTPHAATLPQKTNDSAAQTEENLPPLKKHALLLQLDEPEALLASKLLATANCVVTREDQDLPIPASFFAATQTQFTILFDRDRSDYPPPTISSIRKMANPRITLVALSRTPRSPRILRELRNGLYHSAIPKPVKAVELFRSLESRTNKGNSSTPKDHPNFYR